MPLHPTHKVELSLQDPLTTPVWIDISDYVLSEGIQTSRGRQSELERFQAGTASVTLKNFDARFDPSYAGEANLITNPSVEAATTGYSASSGATVARSSLAAQVGTWSLLVTTANLIFSGVEISDATAPAVVPNLTYTWSLYARLVSAGSHAITMYIDWYNANGFLISEITNAVTLTTTTMTRFSLSGVAPPGAVVAKLYFDQPSAGGVWGFYTDAWQFEQAAAASVYFDGAQAGSRWGGTAHASVSYRGGSPYYPNLRPQNRLRISQVWNSVTYPQFDGYVEGWVPEHYDLDGSLLHIRLSDAFVLLSAPLINLLPPYTVDDPNNLLANQSFETDFDEYVAVGSATLALEDNSHYFGERSLAVTVANLTDSGVRYSREDLAVVRGGLPYTYAIWVKSGAGSTKSFNLRMVFYNGATPLNEVFRTVAIPSQRWRRYYVSGIAGEGADRVEISFKTAAAQTSFVVWTDGWMFAQAWVNLDQLPEELSGERLNRLLDAMGWPSAERNILPGASTLLEHKELTTTNLLTYAQTVEASENGRLFMARDGKVRFIGRWDMGQTPYTVPQAVFGQNGGTELPFASPPKPSADLTFVRNEIRLTNIEDNAVEQVATDATSVRRYGPRPKQETGLLVSRNELASAAEYELDRYKDFRLRFVEIELTGAANPDLMWPILLSLELSDRVTLKYRPPGRPAELVQDCFIEGIRWDCSRRDLWRLWLTLSAYGIGNLIYPPGKTFFVLGTSALNSTGVLVY